MRQKTEQEALASLSALCAKGEHCSKEMIDKMQRWELSEEAQAHVMEYLTSHQYVDDERFTRAFVADKIRYNKWGRRKIEQALWMKGISKDLQNAVLDEIDDEVYLEILRPLLDAKRRTIKAQNEYEEKMKLIRFGLGRGFLLEQIQSCLE